jgi:putative ABC transport system substrate-binding protein
VSWFANLVTGKGLGLLHELVPNAAVIALLVNPRLPETARMEGEGREAARSLGLQLLILNASIPRRRDLCTHLEEGSAVAGRSPSSVIMEACVE